MNILRIKSIALLLGIGFLLYACSFGSPESCGENIGGTADTAKFDQYFIQMALVNQSGVSGTEGENGMEFTSTDSLELRADTKSDVAVRACVQNLSKGPITFDETHDLTIGSDGFALGVFETGNYVVRVIVNDTLVKNFPFSIK
jgi:hypothetical protein